MMRWVPLELDRSSEIGFQVDTVIDTYNSLQRQLIRRETSDSLQIKKALEVLRHSFANRLEEMTIFYQENDLDPRSGEVEAARLKLKRFLHSVESSYEERDLKTEAFMLPLSPEHKMTKPTDKNHGKEIIEVRKGEEEAGSDMVTLRVVLTEEEYQEILARREAVRQLKLNAMLYKQ
ncbi:hypothetical protein BCY84_11848 [Trypanosoma cruzi cruzi]|nr:hypothetical protein BCY84_11848 [Trypanosoma cruzi cruzi]